MAFFANWDDDEDLLIRQIIQNVEEVEEEQIIPPRQIWIKINPFEASDESFIKNFRLTKNITRSLVEDLAPFLTPPSRRSAINLETKVLVALNFFAQGAYQENIGKNIFNAVSQASVSRCIEEVCVALNNDAILQRYIQFPNNLQQLRQVQNRFYQRYNFPGVIGCIDGSHIAINMPAEDEHIYVNRKNFHSLNVQVICDENLKIMNINPRFPGSCHDAHIWRQSNIRRLMEQIHEHFDEPFFLIGDSGYPLRPWLLTAIENPLPGSPEERFSNHLRTVRSSVERCIGKLKNRFRCLLRYRTLHYTPIKAASITRACAVLHNLCITNNLPEPDHEHDGDMNLNIDHNINPNYMEHAVNPLLAEGRRLRQQIINAHYR